MIWEQFTSILWYHFMPHFKPLISAIELFFVMPMGLQKEMKTIKNYKFHENDT
jgi:hypothetical protein